ncbi:MAG: hypothetical protein DHS20C12_01460 [Pseudohongiella sp.]|nr:MAG: hypothetical protein DHS20C12_01460 [Pseudohongiella sp.]
MHIQIGIGDQKNDMNIVHSQQDIRIAAPISCSEAGQVETWLSSMSDSGWRILTDFRNWPIWIPGIHNAELIVPEPPARGTQLQVIGLQGAGICSIDRWDPPRSLHISFDYPKAQIAYGFQIEADSKACELRISLKLERNLSGLSRLVSPLIGWRLHKLGKQMLEKLAARTRPAKVLQG